MRALLLLTLIGCKPNDAVVEGHWFSWLAANSSGTVSEEVLPGLADTATVFECKTPRRGWNLDDQDWDEGYVGPRDSEQWSDPRYIGGDCPYYIVEGQFDGDGNQVYEYDAYCAADMEPDPNHPDGLSAAEQECERIDAMVFHDWLRDDGYYALQGPIDAWRTEALINGEGDLQLTVHHELSAKEDFRFNFVIAPDFAPVVCATDASGVASAQPVDGSSWLEQWSTDEDGHTIYYLNQGARQVSPKGDSWYLTTDWIAGFGFAKFSSDEFYSHPGDYGDYDEAGNGDHFVGVTDLEREAPDMDVYLERVAALELSAADWQREMVQVAGANTGEGGWHFEHKIEDNTWRPLDGSVSGLDGWIELHSSWVRVNSDSNIEPGGRVFGDFQILYDATESGTRTLVQGTFDIEELREDKWAYDVLEDDKREESGETFCK